MDIFSSTSRDEFFSKSGLPLWDISYNNRGNKVIKPYALFTCIRQPKKRIKEIRKASEKVAYVFDKVLYQIKEWPKEEFVKWGFDEKAYDLITLCHGSFFCFRAGWGWDGEQLKLIEINTTDPTFLIEPEVGNDLLAREFNLKNPTLNSTKYLKSALNICIKTGIKNLPKIKRKNPKVGFVCINWKDDLNTVSFLASFCDYEYEVFPIEDLDFSLDKNKPFNRKTGTIFEILLPWYPMEWLMNLKFKNKESVWDIIINAILADQVEVAHALPSFFLRPKSIFAYITANKESIFTGKLKSAEKYFPKTYLSPKPLGKSYFTKPIWGIQGQASILVDKKTKIKSRLNEKYYRNQKRVYQQLLSLPQQRIGDQKLFLMYEAWVYRVGDHFKSGGIGIRADNYPIINNDSYWLPIGV